MTLEQIKNRQDRMNDQLHELIIENSQVVDYIAGASTPQDTNIKGCLTESNNPNGLIEQIGYSQDVLEVLLSTLRTNNKKFYAAVYSSETKCPQN